MPSINKKLITGWSIREYLEYEARQATKDVIAAAKALSNRALELEIRMGNEEGYVSSTGSIQGSTYQADISESRLQLALMALAYLDICELCHKDGHHWKDCNVYDVHLTLKDRS